MTDPSPTIVWLHEDSVSPEDPALVACPESPAVWVWDDVHLAEDRYSLKRVAFLYESVLETRAEIWRGDTVPALLEACRRHGAQRIVATESVNPRFATIVAALRSNVQVEILEPKGFLPRGFEADLRRFARFWKKAEPYAFGKRSA